MAEASGTTGQAAPAAGTDGADGIGRRLAAHRARRGLRVAELARDVGVTPSLISQIERGQSRPSVSTLFALAQALRVPVDAFFRESPQPAAPALELTGSPSPPWAYDTRRPGDDAPPADDTGAGAAAGREAAAGTVLRQGEASPPGGEVAAGDARPGGGRYLVRKGNRAAIDIEGGVRWERLTRNTMDHLDFFELIYEPGAQSHPRQYTHPGTEMVLVMRGRLEITVGFERYLLDPGDSLDFPSSMPHRYVNPGDETAHAVTVILYDCPDAPGGGPGRRNPAP
jgi:transcriptional regulator with XRE-family HTH domain/quercetin dioxygenase-like cupin family protein